MDDGIMRALDLDAPESLVRRLAHHVPSQDLHEPVPLLADLGRRRVAQEDLARPRGLPRLRSPRVLAREDAVQRAEGGQDVDERCELGVVERVDPVVRQRDGDQGKIHLLQQLVRGGGLVVRIPVQFAVGGGGRLGPSVDVFFVEDAQR